MIETGSLEFWKYIAIGCFMTIKSFGFAIGSYWLYRAVKEYVKRKKQTENNHNGE